MESNGGSLENVEEIFVLFLDVGVPTSMVEDLLAWKAG